MAQSTMKIDSEIMARLQKIKAEYFAKYRRTISLGEVVQRILDRDIIIVSILNEH